MFLKTLTAGDKPCLLNRDNLTQPLQMQLSQKQKTFAQLFFESSKFILHVKHLATKDDNHS